MVCKRARWATEPRDQDLVDMSAWRRAEAQAWEGRGPTLAWVLAPRDPGTEGVGRAAQAAGGHAAEVRPGEPHPARPAPDLANRALVAGTHRGSPGPGGPDRGLVRGSRPVPRRRAGRARQGTRRKRPANRADGAGVLPQGAAERGGARTGGAGDEGARGDMGARARPEHDSHSPPPVSAPTPRAWRERIRAVSLGGGIAM